MSDAAMLSPDFLRSLELFRLHARRLFLGTRQGGHLSLKRGHGIEFSDYRQYELGDNPRHIDWGVYGKTDRLFVKRFQEEQELQVLLLLDASASMSAIPADGKWERSRSIALALGYIALMSQDSVHLGLLGEPPRQDPARGQLVSPRSGGSFIGPRAFHQLMALLREVVPEGRSGFAVDIARAAARVRFPGVAILISDLLVEFDQIERGLNALRAKNLDVTVIQVLGASDRRPPLAEQGALVEDSETGEQLSLRLEGGQLTEYERLLDRHVRRVQEFCAGSRIGFIQSFPEEDLAGWIQEALPQVGLLR